MVWFDCLYLLLWPLVFAGLVVGLVSFVGCVFCFGLRCGLVV